MLTLFLIYASITGTIIAQQFWRGLKGMNTLQPWKIFTGCMIFGYAIGWFFLPILFLKNGPKLYADT